MAVSQAVDTPNTRVPMATPTASPPVLARYSKSSVDLLCSQFSLGGSSNDASTTTTGIHNTAAASTMTGTHNEC